MAERGIHEPLSETEMQSFRDYATENITEADGTECQWASYTLRALDDIARLDFANKGHVDHIKYLDEKLAALERERDGLRDAMRLALEACGAGEVAAAIVALRWSLPKEG